MKRALTPLLASLAAFGVCGACGGLDERLPNVLLITLDTLRADRLGCYGGEGGLTPNLDALAASATRWERCAASAPWTIPSHASMFTGRDPHAHGAVSFGAQNASVDNVYVLAEEHITLAEALAEVGYQTGGIVANAAYLKPAFGLDQGFETWRIARERAPRVNREALTWIDGRHDGRPWMLFLNYMDVHRPYNVEPIEGERAYEPDEFSSDLIDQLYRRVIIRGKAPGELTLRVQEQYDRATRNLDRALGELFDALRERGIWDDTMVVVTADHGEYFGEHGLVEHSKDVYEEALSVPLIVKYVGQTAGRVERVRASSAHLPRIVLEGLPASLRARYAETFGLAPGAPVVAENYYSRLRDILDSKLGDRFRRVRAVLYDGDWKLILSSDGAHELYHLGEDPHELDDRAGREAQRVERMVAELTARRDAGRFAPSERGTVEMDVRHREELGDMGYGGADDDGDGDGEER